MNERIVYVVSSMSYTDFEVEGVFTSIEAAMAKFPTIEWETARESIDGNRKGQDRHRDWVIQGFVVQA